MSLSGAVLSRRTGKDYGDLNKRHWNTVYLDGSMPDSDLMSMIDDSYDLVVKGLKKADRLRLSVSSGLDAR